MEYMDGITYVIFNAGTLSPPFLQGCEGDMHSALMGTASPFYRFGVFFNFFKSPIHP